jgi:carbon-monoxide dehydrogenase small subunit
MKVPISLTVNGRQYEAEVEPQQLLVYFLREDLGLTGTHVGCDTSNCGACTVLMDGAAVKACNVLSAQADGVTITTIEGVAQDGELHPVQEAFWSQHGLQCGFCTPGMIMSTIALLDRIPDPSPDQIRHGIEGNLCRCTGYHNIIKAIQAASEAMSAAAAEPAGTRVPAR